MDFFEAATCIKFREKKPSDKQYLKIFRGIGYVKLLLINIQYYIYILFLTQAMKEHTQDYLFFSSTFDSSLAENKKEVTITYERSRYKYMHFRH